MHAYACIIANLVLSRLEELLFQTPCEFYNTDDVKYAKHKEREYELHNTTNNLKKSTP